MTSPFRARRAPGARTRPLLVLLLVLAVQLVAVDAGVAAPEMAPKAASPARASSAPYCKRPAHGFAPVRARIPAIGRSVRVIQVKRTANNTVGAGPVTEKGKWLMAMDPYTLPASRHGSVLLSGHTWPDGSALGNAMLANLYVGDRLVLVDKSGRKHACYQVAKRKSYRVHKVPRREAFRTSGPEKVVIVACSGKRLGPGRWTRRTLWTAVPVIPKKRAPATPTSPAPPSSPPPGLLGLLLGGL